MDTRITITLACALMALLSLPLILRWVPPNLFYGFRTPRTLSNPDIWYPANAFSGQLLLAAAVVVAALTWLLPASLPAWLPIALLLGGLAVVLIASILHLRRYR